MGISNKLSTSSKWIVIVVLCVLLCVLFVLTHFAFKKPTIITSIDRIPSDYKESDESYKKFVETPSFDAYSTVDGYISITVEEYGITESFESVEARVTPQDEEIILLSDDEAWSLISNGIFTTYPKGTYSQLKGLVKQIYDENMVMIKVPCWYWEDPSDDLNMNKVTVEKKFAVNTAVSQLFIDIFSDIYRDPSKPVINIADAGMGTWVLRGKNHNSNSTLSGHSLGTTIDINPSTGSFLINGTWYGNGYGHKRMSRYLWEQLPECHSKYHVLYDDCPIVQVFKSYGFQWGGDWKTGTDCMHFSFLGDGADARLKGQTNFYRYN